MDSCEDGELDPTLSISNETLDTIGNWFGLVPQGAIRNSGW